MQRGRTVSADIAQVPEVGSPLCIFIVQRLKYFYPLSPRVAVVIPIPH